MYRASEIFHNVAVGTAIETLAKNCSRLRCLDINIFEGISFRVVDYI
jgi:hypothetical protein